LMSEAPVLAKSKERPLPELAAAIAPPSAGQPINQMKEPTETPPVRHASPIPPPKPRVEFTLERIYRGQPGQTLALPISAKLPLGPQTGAFVALRGFPTGATLSHGQGLGPSLWTVPLDNLAGLKIRLPADAPDVSLITIEAFDAQSSLLANAAFVVVAARPVEPKTIALAPVARPPAAPATASRFQQDVAGWSSTRDTTSKDDALALMVSARHRQLSIERELTWSNMQPRQNLVHVALVVDTVPSAAPSAAKSEKDVSVTPHQPVGRLELLNANHDSRNLRTDFQATGKRPAEKDDDSHWRSYKPKPDLARLVKRPELAAKSPPPALANNDDDEDSEARRVKVHSPGPRAQREDPPAPATSSKEREVRVAPQNSSRGHKQTVGNALGGPEPRRSTSGSATPSAIASGASVGNGETKARLRRELMDPSKGI
jgi:hypothetical protein